jgi:processive 1,2-diacylglycerol beta-glucosyltransferase
MSPRVLILTAGFGEGHNAAARALAAGFDRSAGPGTSLVVDAFALGAPRFNAVARQIYLRLINDAPRLWSGFYDWIDRSRAVERHLWIFRREIRTLAALLDREQPTAICCTYPLYGFFLARLRAARVGAPPSTRSVDVGALPFPSSCSIDVGGVPSPRKNSTLPPIFNIVTDSISIHSLWWRAACDGWFLPNEDSAVVLRRAGLPPARIHVGGFPVPAFFSEHAATLAPPDLAAGARPRVLHIINSGTRHAAATAHRLLLATDWEITCAVGRDDALRRQLQRLADARKFPAQILGWTDQIPRLLMTHHAVVSKAGGATTQEAIAALCPMIVSQVVPGQEEGNYELIRRHDAGALAETPDAVLAELRRAFAHGGRVCSHWRAALRPLARSAAADDIARHVLAATQFPLAPPALAAARAPETMSPIR